MSTTTATKKRKTKSKATKTVNSLICSIPGLKNPMKLQFPRGKLPVCDRCKRIFKTRELCRERDGHTSHPWTKTYVCFILDDSCFEVDEITGKRSIVQEDGPVAHRFIATDIECSPTKYTTQFELVNGKVQDPICTPCKRKNYTKNYCRIRHDHQHLPWGTVYMSLKAVRCEEDSELLVEETTGSKRRQRDSDDDPIAKRTKSDTSTKHPVQGVSNLYSITNNSSAFLLIVSGGNCELKVC